MNIIVVLLLFHKKIKYYHTLPSDIKANKSEVIFILLKNFIRDIIELKNWKKLDLGNCDFYDINSIWVDGESLFQSHKED